MKRKDKSVKPLSREDAKYIESLLSENQKAINTTIYNTLGKDYYSLAEDALGELCLLACEKIETLKTHVCPKAWLIIAAKLVSFDLIREKNREYKRVPLKDVLTTPEEPEVFEEVLYSIWTENHVPQKLLSLLTKQEAVVYSMIYKEGKTVKEIANELNIVENTVRNIHKHLRDKITDAIKRNIF